MARLPEPFFRGKYLYFSYLDEDGRRRQRSTGCTTKKAAREEIERFFAQPGSATIFGDFAADFFIPGKCGWLAAREQSDQPLRSGQVKNKRNHLTKYLIPKWGKWPLDAITARKLRDWLLSLDVTNQTRKHILYTMRAVLSEAVADELVVRNVAKDVGGFSTRNAKRRDALTESELHKLFPFSPYDIERHIRYEQATSHGVMLRIWERPKYYIIGYIMAHTGLRTGEAVTLRWRDIIDDNWIYLLQSKTGAPKVTYLTRQTRELIQLWRGQCIWLDPDDYVFFGRARRNHVSNSTMSKLATAAIRRSGIEKAGRVLSGHSLRHSYNTRLRRQIPDSALRIMTGHATESMSRYYDHPEAAQLIEALRGHTEAIEKALS